VYDCLSKRGEEALAQDINAELAAERENTRRWTTEAHYSAKSEQQLRQQLLAAKEEIRVMTNQIRAISVKRILRSVDDLSALEKHDEEVRKPLVDALEYIANFGGDCFHHDEVVRRAKDALVKVKE